MEMMYFFMVYFCGTECKKCFRQPALIRRQQTPESVREYDYHHDQVAGEGYHAAETPRFLRSAALVNFVCLFGQRGEEVGCE